MPLAYADIPALTEQQERAHTLLEASGRFLPLPSDVPKPKRCPAGAVLTVLTRFDVFFLFEGGFWASVHGWKSRKITSKKRCGFNCPVSNLAKYIAPYGRGSKHGAPSVFSKK